MKRIIYGLAAVLLVFGIVFFLASIDGKKEAVVPANTSKPGETKIASNAVTNKTSDSQNLMTSEEIAKAAAKLDPQPGNIPSVVTELVDGTLYSIKDDVKVDLVVKDNYYDTQINDFYNNYDSYKDKIIEIEGMYLNGLPYTFVGRYSTNNICQYCPTGYSYLEYEWKGDKIPKYEDEQTWIKVIGKLNKAIDDNGVEYMYIDAYQLEVMKEAGEKTVSK